MPNYVPPGISWFLRLFGVNSGRRWVIINRFKQSTELIQSIHQYRGFYMNNESNSLTEPLYISVDS